MRYYAKIKRIDNAEKYETSFPDGRNVKWYSDNGKQMQFLKVLNVEFPYYPAIPNSRYILKSNENIFPQN